MKTKTPDYKCDTGKLKQVKPQTLKNKSNPIHNNVNSTTYKTANNG